MSPEVASPVYPDRLIHPLPKRRLRDRLSSDAADSIKYPPDQAPGAPLFYYPYSLKQDAVPVERPAFVGQEAPAMLASQPATLAAAAAAAAASGPRQGPAASWTAQLPSRARRSSGEGDGAHSLRTARAVNRPARATQSLHMPPAQSYWNMPSAALSADGFDSFEYTSNTKKRKIPSTGDTSHTGSYSSTSLRSTASDSSTNSSYDSLSGSPPSPADVKPANFAGASFGMPGPWRGRYGRSPRYPITAAGRNALLTPAARNVLDSHRKQQFSRRGPLDPTSSVGIVSTAVAHPERRGSLGQEGAAQTAQLRKPDPYPQGSLQFTFTCSSKVPGNLLWDGIEPKAPVHAHRPSQQHGRIRGGGTGNGKLPKGSDAATAAAAVRPKQTEKEREAVKLRQELRKQARDRRRHQQELNAAHPTREGEIYICPFCEFELIVGRKPRLIYEFELKERKKRLEMERRLREQRNKEKARNRNRKGRKAAKAAAATTSSSTQQGSLADEQSYDDSLGDNGQGTVDDEYEDDDGAAEADDFVAELRRGVGDTHHLRAQGRDGEGMQEGVLPGS